MKAASLYGIAAPMNFFVLYDAESASQKKRPKTKGVGSFVQIQSVKQRKANGLQRLRREPWKAQSTSNPRCIKCNSPVPSSSSNSGIVQDEVCPRCDQELRGGLACGTPRLPIEGANSMMDPFQTGAVRKDRLMDWIQQYYLREVWPTIWPHDSSRTRSLPIYDWIVPRFQDSAATVHVRLFTASSIMSVDAGFAKLRLTPALIASQKSKALTQLRSDISDVSKGVDGALMMNVAVLCNIAVFTNTVEDVKPHFLGLSKILEINGLDGVPVMLVETQVFKAYVITEQRLPDSVSFPVIPPISELRFQRLLARASILQPNLVHFAADFLSPKMTSQLSPILQTLLSIYKPLFLCREHFNASSTSELSPDEADYISVQFCHLIRRISEDCTSSCATTPDRVNSPQSSSHPISIAAAPEINTAGTILASEPHPQSEHSKINTAHTRKPLDEVISLSIVLFFLCTTPQAKMISLGSYWRHRKVLRLKAAVERLLTTPEDSDKPDPNTIGLRLDPSILSILFLGAFACRGLAEGLKSFFLLQIRHLLLHDAIMTNGRTAMPYWEGLDGVLERLRRGLYVDRIFEQTHRGTFDEAMWRL